MPKVENWFKGESMYTIITKEDGSVVILNSPEDAPTEKSEVTQKELPYIRRNLESQGYEKE